MTYIFDAFSFALTGGVDFLPTDLVDSNLDVFVGDVFGVTEDDILAAFDGDLTVVDFINEPKGISAGVLFLIATSFLLQPKVISRYNITKLKF
jgi:hypothetical protein